MKAASKRDIRVAFSRRYGLAKSATAKGALLDEFCELTGYHRKYAIALFGSPPAAPGNRPVRRSRGRIYDAAVERILVIIWEAAGYPWSARLKAILPLWLPWVVARFDIDADLESQLSSISPRTIDRVLREHKDKIKRGRFGRTKPGTLLKHHIPIKTDNWDVSEPGYAEIDCVAHCGNFAFGDFANSVNLTDIHTAWTETRAVLGKAQQRVSAVIDEIREALPFLLLGLDCDNGSEFINHHLFKYCEANQIQLTRGRPYKKNDNAHIEQKNWTHVRRILGYARFDTAPVVEAINDLYANELRLWMNFFQPTVKLVGKERVGARFVRRYDAPQTPLDRVLASTSVDGETKATLRNQRAALDPFTLSQRIDQKLDRIRVLASLQGAPKVAAHGYPPGIRKPHPITVSTNSHG
jgi:hypothetical protein